MGFNRFFGASILSLAILAGCGGGGDGTAPATGGGGAGGGGGTTTSGQLTNSPIDGVPYTAAPSGLTGTTMNGGLFNFETGDTVTFNIAGLETHLQQFSADTEVHLRADRKTPYEVVARVLAAASEAGLAKVGFVTDLPE